MQDRRMEDGAVTVLHHPIFRHPIFHDRIFRAPVAPPSFRAYKCGDAKNIS